MPPVRSSLPPAVALPQLPLPTASATTDSAPTVAVDRAALEALPDLAARSESWRRAGNASPYVVFGESYEVLADARNYSEQGLASWYGNKFHGRATSNGEAFDMYRLSAAHKSLPIPCFVRVTNLNNGRSTVLRVNDRGPFHESRLIDLSYAAAVKLGFDLQGTAPVQVEMVAAPSFPDVGPDRGPYVERSATNSFYLQAGAFRSRESAERSVRVLQEIVGTDVSVALQRGQDAIHRIRIGPLPSKSEASLLQSKIAQANQGLALIVRS